MMAGLLCGKATNKNYCRLPMIINNGIIQCNVMYIINIGIMDNSMVITVMWYQFYHQWVYKQSFRW